MRRVSEGLQRLIEANAALWAGEAEVVRSYWDSPGRNRETDRLWIERQMYKEFWDGFSVAFDKIKNNLPRLERGMTRYEFLDVSEVMYEELAHYCLFADVYDAICGEGVESLDPQRLKESGDWKENKELMALRKEHKKLHGEWGARAHAFTEGGYCTLYLEAMKLKGRGGIDDLIADACGKVYEDEFDHMLAGIAGMDGTLEVSQWDLLAQLTADQMRSRILMRNAQFGYPVASERIEELIAGKCEPLAFDYERAGLQS
jgi:hypothetical protein